MVEWKWYEGYDISAGKRSDTFTQHRYTTVTPERALLSVGGMAVTYINMAVISL